ncbi:MAG TPA: hypothetical protein VMV04_22895 [Thermodesulfobacteriota bacterium]|jgi:glutathione synthase/RimK-type ligase-like ATP-grasp enzyme|nr:hypothetical protein [Thermodesulfobacteriota bacterium]
MKKFAVLGVYRENVYSPGKVREDAAILDAALAELVRAGYPVSTVEARDLEKVCRRPSFLLTMSQSEQALGILEGWQKKGIRIINSVSSIRNTYRKPLISLLKSALAPIPPSRILRLEEVGREIPFGPLDSYWLKRGDVHAMEPGDVTKVASKRELVEALDHFRRRGIEEILVQHHVEGDVIKFYGVGPGRYFRAFMTSSGTEVTSLAEGLSTLAHRCAEAVGLEIYGGDAIFSPRAGFTIVDLNDWPSFARCGPTAAREIAQYAATVCKGGANGLPSRC